MSKDANCPSMGLRRFQCSSCMVGEGGVRCHNLMFFDYFSQDIDQIWYEVYQVFRYIQAIIAHDIGFEKYQLVFVL